MYHGQSLAMRVLAHGVRGGRVTTTGFDLMDMNFLASEGRVIGKLSSKEVWLGFGEGVFSSIVFVDVEFS